MGFSVAKQKLHRGRRTVWKCDQPRPAPCGRVCGDGVDSGLRGFTAGGTKPPSPSYPWRKTHHAPPGRHGERERGGHMGIAVRWQSVIDDDGSAYSSGSDSGSGTLSAYMKQAAVPNTTPSRTTSCVLSLRTDACQLAMPWQIWTLVVSYFFACKQACSYPFSLGLARASGRCSLWQLSRSRRSLIYKYRWLRWVFLRNISSMHLQMSACT